MCYSLCMHSPGDIGSALKARRLTLGLTQREVGERLGVVQPQIARWERNDYRTASLATVESVSRALGLELHPVPSGDLLIAAESRAVYSTALPGAAPEALAALARTGVDPVGLAALCRLQGISELSLFGSILSEGFGPQSDVDLLVSYADAALPRTLADLLDSESAFRGLFRRAVDLVERSSVERSDNYIRRRHILDGARTLYVAR